MDETKALKRERKLILYIRSSIIQRCCNKKSLKYKYYGERGIDVCQEWLDDKERFIKDMGPRPTPKHQIDRIDNEKGYYPENCRWTDVSTQQRNKRPMGKSKYKGVTFLRKKKKLEDGTIKTSVYIIAQICIKGKINRIGTFKTELEAHRAFCEKYKETYGEYPPYAEI